MLYVTDVALCHYSNIIGGEVKDVILLANITSLEKVRFQGRESCHQSEKEPFQGRESVITAKLCVLECHVPRNGVFWRITSLGKVCLGALYHCSNIIGGEVKDVILLANITSLEKVRF